MAPIAGMVRLMRPKQWTKNLLVFAAPLFVMHNLPERAIINALLTFVAMCLLSSSVYVVNDLLDAERDRHHPKKKDRPIASGIVSVPAATILTWILLAGGLAVAYTVGLGVLTVVGIYLALQVLYNVVGKHVALLDVFLIAMGFVLRAGIGAIAIKVQISAWLLLCTGALALLIAFGKRRHEFILQAGKGYSSRRVLEGYNRQVLDHFVLMSAIGAALCYGVYAIESKTAHEHPALILSTPFVFYGVFRYVHVVFTSDEGGEPETLLFSDSHIVVTLILFVFSVALAMSGLKLGFLN
jgi:4-hydroxybenzoate polyprenyltransferase